MKSAWSFLLFCSFLTLIEPSIRFTNLKCDELRPDFAKFEKCILKVVRLGVISLNVRVNLLQVPVTNVTINVSLHKKANGYKPFLYNMTVDFCKFLGNRKRHPFVKIFIDMFVRGYNRTCPYNSDIVVENLVLNENSFKYLPLPRGEYMFRLKVAAYNDWKADVKIYIAISDDL